jgi:hypothetical protein
MAHSALKPPVRMLIINPNTSQSMTDALKPVVENLGYHPVSLTAATIRGLNSMVLGHLVDAKNGCDELAVKFFAMPCHFLASRP